MAVLSVLPCFSNPAGDLYKRLQHLVKKGYMFGHQDDPFYGTTWSTIGNMPLEQTVTPDVYSDTYLVTGDYPAVMGFDLGGIELGNENNLDGNPFRRIREEILAHHKRGGIITISWHPRNPLTGGNAWDVSNKETVHSILPGGEKHELFQTWMERVAQFLLSLVDEKGNPVPYILRPWHEYNGSWFWWGEKICTAEEFKALWNMFQDYINSARIQEFILRRAQEPSSRGSKVKTLKEVIVWSCSPNLQGDWTMEHFLQRWPGDNRVDVLGADCYQWGTEADFVKQTTADLEFLSRYAKQSKCILALTECGYKDSPDPTWWTRVLKPILDKFELSYILPWRNWHKEHFGPAPDLATKDDFVKFYNAENTLFLRDIQ